MGLHVVVLAGGSGTRLWPLSRAAIPKHLLPIGRDGATLLRTTVERVLPISDSVHIVTAAVQGEACLAAVEGLLDERHIIAEPSARGTGPALGLATRWIARDDPSAVICSVHADAHIGNADEYCDALVAGAGWAQATDGLVAVGLVPRYPATGLGYIALGEPLAGEGWEPVTEQHAVNTARLQRAAALPAFTATGFVEKPDLERATRFGQDGTHLWNTGLFSWPAAVFEREIRAASPEIDDTLAEVVLLRVAGDEEHAAHRYESLPSVAVDPLVFERTARLTAVRASFDWSDLGSWADIAAVRREEGAADGSGNVVRGDGVMVGARNCYVQSDGGRVVAVVGADNLVVIDTGDAVLVVPADQVQGVRTVTERLREDGRTDLL